MLEIIRKSWLISLRNEDHREMMINLVKAGDYQETMKNLMKAGDYQEMMKSSI